MAARLHQRARRRATRGFTLVELLVALMVMSLVAILSWRGLDGMVRTQAATQERADQVLSLQVGLAQWTADLDALVELPQLTALEWNGRVLRLTRRAGVGAEQAIVVAAWSRRTIDGRGTWLRWESPPLTTRGQVTDAWQKADIWSSNAGPVERAREVAIVPMDEWQIFFFRGDAWTNPLSSDAQGAAVARVGGGTPQAAAGAAAGATSAGVMPDGVRLALTLPAGPGIGGIVTRDWVSPRVGGGKS
ncbi:MAG TPA: prepilin-type N-terminal cleavage/methylation domain-containing protein [Ramlibacter sp.]|nr:prepilin-type N-terminal cleavage/methylation domain-containing protein [Ramlibacter sp.]